MLVAQVREDVVNNIWEKRLRRRQEMSKPTFDMVGYIKTERELRCAIQSTRKPSEKEKLFKKLRCHLGIAEL